MSQAFLHNGERDECQYNLSLGCPFCEFVTEFAEWIEDVQYREPARWESIREQLQTKLVEAANAMAAGQPVVGESSYLSMADTLAVVYQALDAIRVHLEVDLVERVKKVGKQ